MVGKLWKPSKPVTLNTILVWVIGLSLLLSLIAQCGCLVLVWFEKWPWWKRSFWAVIILVIPLLGWMYYLDRRSDELEKSKRTDFE